MLSIFSRRLGLFASLLALAFAAMTVHGHTAAQTVAQAPVPAADDGVVLVVKGAVKQELRLTAADLKTLARTKVTAKDHDGAAHEYEGVALQALLGKAGTPQTSEMRGKNMTLVVIAEASDGYRALFSLAELDADFAGAQVLVADTADGKPLGAQQGPLRLVVPGDKRQARWVRMLKSIEVQSAGAPQ
jgi:DMSO/TMAO reductase YedYZ molybdopterin-dependent catalytic subunit